MDPRAWRRFRKNRGALVGATLTALVLGVAMLGPLAAPHDPDHLFEDGLHADGTPTEPGGALILGADTLGRDELSRLLHGGRISLSVALAATLVALLLGLLVGVTSGYFGGRVDASLMQLIDILLSLPFLIVAIALNRVVSSPSIWALALLLGCLSWTSLARVTRAKTLQVRELEYVQAARALGMSEARILARHVLPNVLGPAIVIGTTLVAQMIIVESTMSFLGIGVQPPTSTWGTMLHDAQFMMSLAPRLVLFPGLLIVATVFGWNLLGEGLRDALDPKDAVGGGTLTPGGERRVGLIALAIFGSVVLSLAFLLPPIPTTPAFDGTGADEPQHGGTFVFHHESDVRGFDPHVSWDELSNMGLKLMFEGLIDYDYDLDFEPRIARELPEGDDGGLTWTFRLREDVRFSNGRPLTAEDVRWSMEHMLHPDTASPGAVFYSALEGFEEFHEGHAEHVRGIEVLDDYTIRFRLATPDQTFLNSMALTFAYPVAREAYEAHPDDVARHPIATGAYVLETWEPGVRVTFVRNPEYFIEGRPYVDRMVFELNLARGPAFMRFQTADLDHIHRLTPTDYVSFKRWPEWTPYWAEDPKLDLWGLTMNCELAPFTDRHVRRAVAFAVRRDVWNRARANRLFLTGQPIPRGLLGYDPDIEGQHRYDLARAREEMALAGHPVRCARTSAGTEDCHAEGLDEPVEMWVGEGDTGRAYGELAQADLAAIGIAVRLRQVAFPVWLRETGRPRTVQLALGGWSGDYPDPANFLDVLFHSRSIHDTDSENRSFYRNPELDAILDRARSETDRERRRALYTQASHILMDDAPWAFVFQNLTLEAWQPYVRGFTPHPLWDNMYRDVWLDLPRAPYRARSGR